MLKNILYAILLGVGMAACLADRDSAENEQTTLTDTTGTAITAVETAGTPSPDPSAFVIGSNKVGSVQIGMPIEEIRQHVPQGYTITDTTLRMEGQDYTAYVLHAGNGGKGLLVEQQCEPECKVWRLRVRDADYKTAQGIGIGSKYGEVQKSFPISYVGPGEGNFVAVSEKTGMTFVLNVSQLPKDRLSKLKPADVPANTIVESIFIF
ncbi:mechanosensitive ion channel protein MscS [Pontibacter ruber]|uniref:Mechanosensitive ion channel protein MscS n=1 Tax=Pontibacter ruber TaxID=1343895 RepID=A0ABW5CZ23_9BACT|nr:mechanosensitive ion channel protein MscS [Pontibacter ruber]